MKTLIIACSMIKDELEKVISESGADIETVWMEKGLHERPDTLRQALQEEIDRNQDKDIILLAYCLCGNAVLGLKSGKSTLVIPKFDDCIRLLRSAEPNRSPEVDAHCLYFTRGWIESDKFMFRELAGYREKYGEKKAARIIESMLGNYTGVRLVDTGAYDLGDCERILMESVKGMKLDYAVVSGSRRVLEKLIEGKHDSEFCIISPGRAICLDDFNDRTL